MTKHMTKADVIYAYTSEEPRATICKKLGIKLTTFKDLKSGKSWRHVTQGLPKGTNPASVDYVVGEGFPNAKLTDQKALAILLSTDSAPALAKQYGVDRSAIYRIRSGTSWTHVLAAIGKISIRMPTDSSWIVTVPVTKSKTISWDIQTGVKIAITAGNKAVTRAAMLNLLRSLKTKVTRADQKAYKALLDVLNTRKP